MSNYKTCKQCNNKAWKLNLCFKHYNYPTKQCFCNNCEEQAVKMNLCEKHFKQLVGAK